MDNNCNGLIDEGFVINIYYIDNDEDGFGSSEEMIESCFQPAGYANNDNDCDDSNPNVHPNSDEICDGIDNNCNQQTDEGFDLEMWWVDSDNDGYGNPNSTIMSCFMPDGYADNGDDCNDVNANVNPSSNEICNNSDDNCNGEIDEGVATQNFYQDSDDDGYGNPDIVVEDCSQPNGYVQNNLDCDDSDDDINPAASEIMDDGIDQDCDGEDLMTGIDELSVGNIDIFPNPTTGQLNISSERNLDYVVEIYDAVGKLVLNTSVYGENNHALDISNFSIGVYTLRLSFQNGTINQKIIKK